MEVYRIAKKKYIEDLSGQGARLVGGRWNSKGVAVLYTAQSLSLAAFELAVHVGASILPNDLAYVKIVLPRHLKPENVDISTLPKKWNEFSFKRSTQKIGDAFLSQGDSLALGVPSAVIPGEFNYLLNPLHKSFGKIAMSEPQSFQYDKRLFFR